MRPAHSGLLRRAALVLTLILALVSAWCTTIPAQADKPAQGLKAITAMESKTSSLRRGPDGKPLGDKKLMKAAGLGAESDSLGSSDLMGTPADKTIARSQDQVFREDNLSGQGQGNVTGVSTYGLTSNMSPPNPSPAYTTPGGRATIDHRYPSVHGHFRNATRESVLQFKSTVAGPDSVFQLSTGNAAAEARAAEPDPSDVDLTKAGTFVIKRGENTLVTNTSALVSGAVTSEAAAKPPVVTVDSLTPSYAQQWAIVPTGVGHLAQLVSRSDGMCLAHTTDDSNAVVQTEKCTGDHTQLWGVFSPGDTLTAFHVTNDPASLNLTNDGGTALRIGDIQTWELHKITEPGGSVPTWSDVRTGGYTGPNQAAPYAMAAGDLDAVTSSDEVETSPGYHDEAVVAYTDSSNRWQLRVVDYNATPGHLLVTGPDPSVTSAFGQTGATIDGIWNPGDYLVEVGDFNGDGRNEIATGAQGSDFNFVWTFWRYDSYADGSRHLEKLTDLNAVAPFKATDNITGQQGYADSTVGDFDGDGHDDIALAYANHVSTTTADSGRKVNLGVWTLNPDLSTRSVTIVQPAMDDGDLSFSMRGDPSRTSSGIQLVAGHLLADPDSGFGPQRSELAIAWSGYSISHEPNVEMDKYTITPVMNIYTASTGDCNSSGTTCAGSIDPANSKIEKPTVLFPTNPSQTAYRGQGVGYDIPPVSLEVGAFGGSDAADPPVDGLLASAWLEYNLDNGNSDSAYYTQQSIVVPWVAKDDTHTKWTINDWRQQTSNRNWTLTRFTSYDGLGTAVVLGAPAVLNLEQNIKENIVAGEPPTHVDWLNAGWSNVSASDDFFLQTKTTSGKAFTSSTSNENSWSNGVTEGLDVKAKWSDTIAPGVNSSGYAEVKQKFAKTWSGLTQTSGNTSNTWSTTTAAQTNQDDLFSFSADDTELYRYPIIGTPGEVTGGSSCSSGCRTYYDVYVPKGSVHFNNVPGKSTSLFQPAWQNMNALSYPAVNSNAANPVPTPDLGGYSYTDQNGTVQTVTQPLYNSANTVGGNNSTVDLDFSSMVGSGATTTHARSWTVGTDVTVSGKVTVGVPGDNVSLAVTGSSGFDVSKSTTDVDTGTSVTSSDQSFTLNVPSNIDVGRSYSIGTAYYYGTSGAAKVVHGVDLTGAQQGRGWWNANYGKTPDPALNLPGRIELTYDSNNYKTDSPLWLTAPQRQLIRGFQVLQSDSDGTGLPTAGSPYTVNPSAGQNVTFEIAVHNYSLKPMTSETTANWYAVPVDGNDIDVTGSQIALGSSVVPAIGAQGSVDVQSPVWNSIAGNTMQQYRIVVRLDEAGTAADMHPLSGSACPVSSLEPTDNNSGDPALYDVMRSANVADPLGCGQNNQGYGLVTVSPAAPAKSAGATAASERHATSQDPARAKLSGGGLVDTVREHLRLTEKSDVPTIPVGQRITGLAHATAAVHTDDHPLVAVYDGPVSEGKIVAVTRMKGIDDKAGGTAAFSWTPDTPGLHELHHVLLGTNATGEDDEQIMRVNVAEPKDQYTVTATSSASWVKSGGAYAISGKISPVPGRAHERTVTLQRKIDGRWNEVASQQTSSTGAYAFDLTAEKVGPYTYRVVKLPTAGRREAASPTLTVLVQDKFVVTVKAKPTSVKKQQTITFTGTVSPPQAAKSDRVVELQVKSGAKWKKVMTGATSATGSFTLRTKPTKTGQFSYRVTKRATRLLPTASSKAVSIKVARR